MESFKMTDQDVWAVGGGGPYGDPASGYMAETLAGNHNPRIVPDDKSHTSVITRRISFRAGHVVLNPHVHDFEVEVEVLREMDTSGENVGMGVDVIMIDGILTNEIAVPLGHAMHTWIHETPEACNKPCDWPNGIRGPEFPVKSWNIRPTVENMGRFVAHRILNVLGAHDPKAKVQRVDLQETPRTRTIFTGANLESTRIDPFGENVKVFDERR